MEDKSKYGAGQLFNFTPGSYLERTSRPVYALLLLLPFIVFYELGTILINTSVLDQSQVRVVAFVWLQNVLEHIGLGGKFAWAAPAVVVVIILFALQLTSRKPWRFLIGDVVPMLAECTMLAVPLIVLSMLLNSSAGSTEGAATVGGGLCEVCMVRLAAAAKASVVTDVVTGIGAGIYEELVFRLILICALMMLFQDVLRVSHRNAIIISVLLSAALFSVHHHIVFLDGRFGSALPFAWPVFAFRTIAGVYFAVLFAIRGFGITAGTHAVYDIIATLINAAFFANH